MRVTVLTTGTNNTPALYLPLARLGHELTVITYDALAPGCQDLPMLVHDTQPDWVLYIGALEVSHGKPVPPVAVLRDIGSRHQLVHLCCDGAEPAWWPQLSQYYDEGRFALQVNIDGVRTGPIGERGLTLLPPIDPAGFSDPPLPLAARKTLLGFSGYAGQGARASMLTELTRSGLLTYRSRDDGDNGSEYRDFLGQCVCAWNHPLTAGGTRAHVKARCVEAGLAGALLLEAENSPLSRWFTPLEDYAVYRDAEDVVQTASLAALSDLEKAQKVVNSMRSKILSQHTPEVFWGRVMARLGMIKDSHPEPELRMVPWSLDAGSKVTPIGGTGLVSYDGKVF